MTKILKKDISHTNKNKRLTEIEKGEILTYNESGLKRSQIADLLERSWTVIDNLLKDPSIYGTKKSPGRPKVLSTRDKSSIKREIRREPKSLNKVKDSLNLSASKSTIWNFVNQCSEVQYIKLDSSPPYKEEHFEARKEWAEEHLAMGKDWKKIVFSDEKKFNLDGPNGYKFYWHHINSENKVSFSRNFGGGNVMVWAAIGYYSRSNIVRVEKMNSLKYQEVLKDNLLPKGLDIGGRGGFSSKIMHPYIHHHQLKSGFMIKI